MIRIASNQMLPNSGRTRSTGGPRLEIGLASAVGKTRRNASGELDLHVRRSSALRLIDTSLGSHKVIMQIARARQPSPRNRGSHETPDAGRLRRGAAHWVRPDRREFRWRDQSAWCRCFQGWLGRTGDAASLRRCGPRAPVSPRPAIQIQAAIRPSIPPTAGDQEADFPAYEPSPPPSPLANPVLPSRSG